MNSSTYKSEDDLTDEEICRLHFLQLSVRMGDAARVKQLLERNLTLNSETGGETLWIAVLSDKLKVAAMLVEAGAALNVLRPDDNLHRITHLLHELVSRNTPAHHRLTMLMVERGASLDNRDVDDSTVLEYALRTKYSIDRITDFLEKGASVTGKCVVFAARHPAATELVPMFVELGLRSVDVETRNRRVFEALSYCGSRWVDESKVLSGAKILLDANLASMVEIQDKGFSVRAMIEANKVNLMRLLIKHGFDLNKQSFKDPLPLTVASSLKKSRISELLIKAGAEVNALSRVNANYKGYAIHAACKKMSVENVKILLRHGVDVDVLDRWRKTPFSLTTSVPYVKPSSKVPMRRLARNPCSPINDLRRGAAHRMLIKYMALRVSKGETINNGDLKIIWSHSGMSAYYNECFNELESIKVMKIVNDISLFFIFKESMNELAFMTRSCNFLKKCDEVQRKGDFPIYREEIDFRIKNAVARRELLSNREEALCDSLKQTLPYVPLEKVIYYFHLNDVNY